MFKKRGNPKQPWVPKIFQEFWFMESNDQGFKNKILSCKPNAYIEQYKVNLLQFKMDNHMQV